MSLFSGSGGEPPRASIVDYDNPKDAFGWQPNIACLCENCLPYHEGLRAILCERVEAYQKELTIPPSPAI